MNTLTDTIVIDFDKDFDEDFDEDLIEIEKLEEEYNYLLNEEILFRKKYETMQLFYYMFSSIILLCIHSFKNLNELEKNIIYNNYFNTKLNSNQYLNNQYLITNTNTNLNSLD